MAGKSSERTSGDAIKRCLSLLAAMRGEQFTEHHATMYTIGFFDRVPHDVAMAAVMHALRHLTHRPSVAELWQIIEERDGRPTPEQAWGWYPKDEYQSAVVTEEMQIAANAAWPLLMDGDRVAARMAFIERYREEVKQARAKGIPVKWTVTIGYDQNGRGCIYEQLVERARMTDAEARNLMLRIGIEPPPQDSTRRSIDDGRAGAGKEHQGMRSLRMIAEAIDVDD